MLDHKNISVIALHSMFRVVVATTISYLLNKDQKITRKPMAGKSLGSYSRKLKFKQATSLENFHKQLASKS